MQWLCEERDKKPYYIVDGQQRVTSMLILLKSLINLGEGIATYDAPSLIKDFLFISFRDSCYPLFGYIADNPSDKYWRSHILGIHEYSIQSETAYTNNLKDAKRFFDDRAKENKGKVDDLLRRLLNRLMFNVHKIEPEYDVGVVFETMNNRGIELSALELLKNRFIYLSSIIEQQDGLEHDAQALRRLINETWTDIYTYLGREPKLNLSDKEYLKQHTILYYGKRLRDEDFPKNHLLKDLFSVKGYRDGAYGINGVRNHVASLRKNIKYWYQLRSCQHDDPQISLLLKKIRCLNYEYYQPIIMAAMQYETSAIIRVLEAIERALFISNLVKTKGGTGETELHRLAEKLLNRVDDTNPDTVINYINKMVCELFSKKPKDQKTRFEARMDEILDKDEAFYQWRHTKYILYIYEELLASHEYGGEKISWDDFDRKQIEHILPQNTTNWKDTEFFSQEYKGDISFFMHSIGNLVVMRAEGNSAASNMAFHEKREIYQVGSYSEIEIARNNFWRPKDVRDRSIQIMRYIGDFYKIPKLNDERYVLEALGYGEMIVD